MRSIIINKWRYGRRRRTSFLSSVQGAIPNHKAADLAETIVSDLDYGISRIERIFDTTAEIPFLNVFLCPSRLVFGEFLRVITTVPIDTGRIGTPHGHDLYFLSPKSYRSDAPYYGRDDPPFYDVVDFRRILVRELVHLWEEISQGGDGTRRRLVLRGNGDVHFGVVSGTEGSTQAENGLLTKDHTETRGAFRG